MRSNGITDLAASEFPGEQNGVEGAVVPQFTHSMMQRQWLGNRIENKVIGFIRAVGVLPPDLNVECDCLRRRWLHLRDDDDLQ